MDLAGQFEGALLGLALGDALGAPCEGGVVERAAWWVLGLGRGDLLRWTDDTEMALGLARSLAACRGLDADHLARGWATQASRLRGYGGAAWRLLMRIRAGEDWRVANRAEYAEGSFGNGAAMRAAPLGLWFHRDPAALHAGATLASSITHAHPLGIEGGVLMARATAQALAGRLDLEALRAGAQAAPYRERLALARGALTPAEAAERLGNSIVAAESVVTALHAAARFQEFEPMLAWVIEVGGDTDTIGAMAGALFGARHGVGALPPRLLDRLEARAELEGAARALFAAWQAAHAG